MKSATAFPGLFTMIALTACGALDKPVAASASVPAAPMLDPVRTQAFYLDIIGKLHADGKSHAALAYLDDFDRRYPGQETASLLRADCLLAVGRSGEAQGLYQGLVTGSNPAAAEAGLGRVAAERGDWNGAAAAYERAVAAAPVHVPYRNDLGYALLKAGRTDKALFVLRQADQLAPGNPVIRNNLALALAGTKRLK